MIKSLPAVMGQLANRKAEQRLVKRFPRPGLPALTPSLQSPTKGVAEAGKAPEAGEASDRSPES